MLKKPLLFRRERGLANSGRGVVLAPPKILCNLGGCFPAAFHALGSPKCEVDVCVRSERRLQDLGGAIRRGGDIGAESSRGVGQVGNAVKTLAANGPARLQLGGCRPTTQSKLLGHVRSRFAARALHAATRVACAQS